MIETFVKQLNVAQYEAVTTTEGPVLVIAGAGSGKTRVIEFRSLYLIRKNVDPESILLLTFTRRSAQEMIERAARNDTRCSRIDGGTFHSFASKVLRRYGRNIGLSNAFTIYDESDAEDAIGRCCNKIGLEETKEFPKKTELKMVFSLCVNKELDVDNAVLSNWQDYEDVLGEIRAVRDEYSRYKLKNNCVDYDDLLVHLRTALQNEEIRRELSGRYRYIMVDEFQDTNPIQSDIVHLLSSGHGNIMVVGDDAQSIYGFRGASHRNILEFPERFMGCRVIKLETNYRSHQSILDVGNAVLRSMPVKFDKKLISTMPDAGRKPTLRCFDDVYEEAVWVGQKIKNLFSKDIHPKDIAVLFRTAYASMALQAELVKQGIRFRLFGGRKFYETAHVRDVIAYLRIAANPADELAWHRVLLLLPGVGIKTVERLLGLIDSYDNLHDISDRIFGPLCADRKHSDVFSSFKILLDVISHHSIEPAGQVDKVLHHYGPIMKSKYRKDPAKARELTILQHMAQRYSSLKDFLADMAVDSDKDGKDSDTQLLTLSTVHSAKGLEWERVFIIGLVDGIFPSNRALTDGDDDGEEEKRLLYVAVTRAKEELVMSYYHKGRNSERSSTGLCRFLEPPEVRGTYEERVVTAAVRAACKNASGTGRRKRF